MNNQNSTEEKGWGKIILMWFFILIIVYIIAGFGGVKVAEKHLEKFKQKVEGGINSAKEKLGSYNLNDNFMPKKNLKWQGFSEGKTFQLRALTDGAWEFSSYTNNDNKVHMGFISNSSPWSKDKVNLNFENYLGGTQIANGVKMENYYLGVRLMFRANNKWEYEPTKSDYDVSIEWPQYCYFSFFEKFKAGVDEKKDNRIYLKRDKNRILFSKNFEDKLRGAFGDRVEKTRKAYLSKMPIFFSDRDYEMFKAYHPIAFSNYPRLGIHDIDEILLTGWYLNEKEHREGGLLVGGNTVRSLTFPQPILLKIF